jgi:hypothetical protein
MQARMYAKTREGDLWPQMPTFRARPCLVLYWLALLVLERNEVLWLETISIVAVVLVFVVNTVLS